MKTPTASPALSPFDLMAYQRDHVPDAARAGMRGYVLNILIGMAGMKGNNRGLCYPSIAYLAKKIGRSIRHVQRLLRELEALGEVERIAQRRKDGGQSSNLYRLKGLISWAARNVRGGGDKRGIQTPTGRIKTPARGVKSGSRGGKLSTPRQNAPSAPVDASGRGLEKSGAVGPFSAQYRSTALGGRSAASTAQRASLTMAQIEEAEARCDPSRWARLLIEAASEGVTGDGVKEGAARRWRGDAIVDGIDLAT